MTSPFLVHRPQVHGHRGCRGLRPENTLPAFLHAIELGVDVIELDVVVSHDLQVVVAHDPWLPAALGTGPAGEPIDPVREREYKLYEMPYAAIRQCALGIWPNLRFPEQVLAPAFRPLLREVVAASQQRCRHLRRGPVGYSVEIKCSPAGDGVYHPTPELFARLVLAELHQTGVADLATILSFDPRVLQVVHQLQPTQRLCLLLEDQAITTSLFTQLGFIPQVFGPDYRLLSPELVRELQNGYPTLQIVPWTVNEYDKLREVVSWQLTGITTDYPDRLLGLLNPSQSSLRREEVEIGGK